MDLPYKMEKLHHTIKNQLWSQTLEGLTMNEKKLNYFLESFVRKQSANPDKYKKDREERLSRMIEYQAYTPDRIKSMIEEDFYEYLGKLWSMLIWGNKKYIVDKIIADNGLEKLKKHLIALLYGDEKIENRWDVFLGSIKGLGPATISELLTYINPEEYVIFNKTTIACFTYINIPNMPIYNYQYTGKKYVEVCNIAKQISKAMKEKGVTDNNLLAVDYFMWDEILPMADKDITIDEIEVVTNSEIPANDKASFLHNEIRDKIVEIGRLQGFESNSEIKVSTGAKVDAIWEARIGNMGKAIYVFEVQTKGSVDSLILNLMKAKNNSAVQAVVAVSDRVQIEKIKMESAGTVLETCLKTWDYQEVLEVYDALTKAHESINKLALVPDSFI